ncbi:MAG: hypothetical protein J1E82_09185 [Muribaculaceae bacterium]|nr:hypothetical protein [Muribaculaceae bacterium]
MNKLELIKSRHSVRSYKTEPLSDKIQNALKAEVTMINTHVAGLKFQLFFNNSDPFNGFFKSYGTFENPSNYLAAIVDDGVENIWEKAGYYAEQFVIKCCEMGLGTCFVGGTYDSKSVNVQLKAGEKILFLVLFGYPSGHIRLKEKWLVNFVHRKKYDVTHFFEPEYTFEKACKDFPGLDKGIEAVACAPSSLNKRPVRLFIGKEFGEGMVCAKVDNKNEKNLIDLGIAKFNYNFVTDTHCQWGNGQPLTGGEID